MHRVWRIGTNFLAALFLLPGCFAYDWDYQGGGGNAGNGGSAGSSSSGGPNSENCTNGTDDDGDGKIDCVDSDCITGYECSVAVPAGWNPYWLLEKPYQDPNATTCPDGQAAMVLFAEPTMTSTCSTCDCTFMGATCTSPQFRCDYNNPDCLSLGTSMYGTMTGQCLPFMSLPPSSYGSCLLFGDGIPLDKGTCSGSSSSVKEPKFGGEIRMCASSADAGAGCDNGDVCVGKKPGAFGQGRSCIEQAGTTQCPDGWTAKSFAAYEDATDSRQCSNCTCDTSTITCSAGKVQIYATGSNCPAVGSYMLDTPMKCVNGIKFEAVTGASASFTLATPSAGTCTQGAVSGSVTTMGPHTVCCRD